MKIITTHELARKGERELSSLFRAAMVALVRSDAGTPERSAALATLENVARVRVPAPR